MPHHRTGVLFIPVLGVKVEAHHVYLLIEHCLWENGSEMTFFSPELSLEGLLTK